MLTPSDIVQGVHSLGDVQAFCAAAALPASALSGQGHLAMGGLRSVATNLHIDEHSLVYRMIEKDEVTTDDARLAIAAVIALGGITTERELAEEIARASNEPSSDEKQCAALLPALSSDFSISASTPTQRAAIKTTMVKIVRKVFKDMDALHGEGYFADWSLRAILRFARRVQVGDISDPLTAQIEKAWCNNAASYTAEAYLTRVLGKKLENDLTHKFKA